MYQGSGSSTHRIMSALAVDWDSDEQERPLYPGDAKSPIGPSVYTLGADPFQRQLATLLYLVQQDKKCPFVLYSVEEYIREQTPDVGDVGGKLQYDVGRYCPG